MKVQKHFFFKSCITLHIKHDGQIFRTIGCVVKSLLRNSFKANIANEKYTKIKIIV